jgi:hypothetical protein
MINIAGSAWIFRKNTKLANDFFIPPPDGSANLEGTAVQALKYFLAVGIDTAGGRIRFRNYSRPL